MTKREKYNFAVRAAQRILVLQYGDMDDPQTWIEVAKSRGCAVYSFHALSGKAGEYAPRDNGQGVIQYNTAYCPQVQARVIVHELAHHLLMSEVPGDLFGEWVHCYYDDDPEDVRHQIARLTEDLCFRT